MSAKIQSFLSSLIEAAKSSKMLSKHSAAVFSGKRVLSVASNNRSDLTNEQLSKLCQKPVKESIFQCAC